MEEMFKESTVFNNDISSWDVSSVTNMQKMFRQAHAFDSGISSWDVSSVKSLDYMFDGAKIFNKDISTWDVSSVTNMRWMFNEAEQYGKKMCEWNLSPGTDTADMFLKSKCTIVECVECPTSSPTTSSPTTTPGPCFGISVILSDSNRNFKLSDNLSNETMVGCFDTSQVTNMDSFLKGRDTFNADLSSWDVSSVTSMQVSCC